MIAAAFLVVPAVDTAQAAKARKDAFWLCDNARNPTTRIRACTHVIKYHRSRANLNAAHHHRGMAWWQKGNLRRALADFNAAIRYNPADADSRRHRRDVLQEMRQRRQKARQRQARNTPRQAAATPAGQRLPRHERLVRQARKLLDDNREPEALKKLRQALELLQKKERKAPLSLKEQLLKAEALVLLDTPEPAMEIWRTLQGRLPPDAAMRDMLIELWHRLDNMGEKQAMLLVGRLTVEATPSKADYHALYHHMIGAEVTGEQEEMDKAARAIIRLWEAGVKHPTGGDTAFFASRAYLLHGNALLAAGDRDGAERAYRKATELKPGYHVAWNNLGWVTLLRGDNELAVEHFEKSLKLSPRYTRALWNLHKAWSNLGMHRRAAQALTRLIGLDPAPDHYQDRGWHWLQAGEVDKAERAARRVLSRNPKHAAATGLKAYVLIRRGEHDKALQTLRRAIEFGLHTPEAYHELGRLLERAGRLQEARRAYERAAATTRPPAGEPPEYTRARQQAASRLSALEKAHDTPAAPDAASSTPPAGERPQAD